MSLGSRTTIETMMMALPHTHTTFKIQKKKGKKNWERKEEASLA